MAQRPGSGSAFRALSKDHQYAGREIVGGGSGRSPRKARSTNRVFSTGLDTVGATDLREEWLLWILGAILSCSATPGEVGEGATGLREERLS